jgi:hypothetical protein
MANQHGGAGSVPTRLFLGSKCMTLKLDQRFMSARLPRKPEGPIDVEHLVLLAA